MPGTSKRPLEIDIDIDKTNPQAKADKNLKSCKNPRIFHLTLTVISDYVENKK
jgi:hypothetical protein